MVEIVIPDRQTQTMALIVDYFDGCRFGYEGVEGYRKSTDLFRFSSCIEELDTLGLLDSQHTVFADIDLFYTTITLHDVFAAKIAAEAKPGALYLV